VVKRRGEAPANETTPKDSKTTYRNYSATVALSEPWEYGGGDPERLTVRARGGPFQVIG